MPTIDDNITAALKEIAREMEFIRTGGDFPSIAAAFWSIRDVAETAGHSAWKASFDAQDQRG